MLLFELFQFVEQAIIFAVGNFRVGIDIVESIVPLNRCAQLVNPLLGLCFFSHSGKSTRRHRAGQSLCVPLDILRLHGNQPQIAQMRTDFFSCGSRISWFISLVCEGSIEQVAQFRRQPFCDIVLRGLRVGIEIIVERRAVGFVQPEVVGNSVGAPIDRFFRFAQLLLL